MSSAFERLQKLAEEKRLKEKAEKPILEIVPSNTEKELSAPSAGSAPKARSLVSAPSAGSNNLSVAPERDFTKVANSIVRQIPIGVFIGKSKQMYDYLYSITRGAIKPTRSARVSKSNLMRGSGIRSTHTFYNNVRYLEAIGLIITTRIDGEKGGNSYEVLLPEEVKGDLAQLAQLAHLRQTTESSQKLPVAGSAVSALPALTLNPIETKSSEYTKTSFKDINTSDDETAFAAMEKTLSDACKKLTGKLPTKTQKDNWDELGQILVMELEIAAARTKSISNMPAFLTEHLRRRLLRKSENAPRGEASKTKGISKSLQVGKPSEEPESSTQTYEAEPLAKEARETVLKTMSEYIEKGQREFVLSLQHTYTVEDWQWLTEQISAAEKTENIEQENSGAK